uniref:Fatty acyl-CoA reductase n=1 Tax=Felis catus TaxID=9685 RepID=A0ABI7YWU6_FELCA
MSMIAAFYGGKSILITGATGFMGKVLMEKLFRTSPDLKVIYILVRTKAGQTTQQRVFQILNSKILWMGTQAWSVNLPEVTPVVNESQTLDLSLAPEATHLPLPNTACFVASGSQDQNDKVA